MYLIGHLQLANDGHFELGLDGERSALALEYQAEYWGTPKRCALWRVDPETSPSRSSSICRRPATPVSLRPSPSRTISTWSTHYSSPFEPGDLAWNEGQLGESFIHRTTITLP